MESKLVGSAQLFAQFVVYLKVIKPRVRFAAPARLKNFSHYCCPAIREAETPRRLFSFSLLRFTPGT